MNSEGLQSEVMVFSHSKMWVANGVLFVEYSKGLVIEMTIARKILAERLKLQNGRRMPLVVDISGLAFVYLNARKFLNSQEALRDISKKAIVSRRPEAALIARTSVLFDFPACEVRVFENSVLAHSWLQA
ncbi:MAG: hypothetical protein IT236_17440 [Bacteroidia bacterium]|nr:hypothetical protein [Bacteroidia bacterium]